MFKPNPPKTQPRKSFAEIVTELFSENAPRSEERRQQWTELQKQYEEMFPRRVSEPTREQKAELLLSLLNHLTAEIEKQNAAKVIPIDRGRQGAS